MKKLFLGLLVAGVALSASAFTNAKKVAQGDYYVQTSTGSYVRINAGDYEPESCVGATNSCYYIQTEEGTYDESLLLGDLDNNSDFQPSSEKGNYTPAN